MLCYALSRGLVQYAILCLKNDPCLVCCAIPWERSLFSMLCYALRMIPAQYAVLYLKKACFVMLWELATFPLSWERTLRNMLCYVSIYLCYNSCPESYDCPVYAMISSWWLCNLMSLLEHERMTIYWITVQDLNDVAPMFDRKLGVYEVQLPENREVGKPTGIRLVVDDPDISEYHENAMGCSALKGLFSSSFKDFQISPFTWIGINTLSLDD